MKTTQQQPINYKFSEEISQDLGKLAKLDNYHCVLALLQDWLVISAAIIITERYFYLYPLCLLIIGSRQRALSTLFHDAAHRRAAKSKILNLMIGTVFSGFWLFQSILRYRESHVKCHHCHLGDKNIDPDFQYYIENGLYDPSLKASEFLLKHVVSALLLLKAPGYIIYLVKNRISFAKSSPLEFILILLCWILVFLSAYYYGLIKMIILYWLVPLFTTHMIIGYFIEMSEHYPFLGTSKEIMHLSRNRFSHWAEGLFFSIHNENYHLIHHLRPDIPFWNMVKTHKVMLQDKKYETINQNFGGIFFSSNGQKSLIKILTS